MGDRWNNRVWCCFVDNGEGYCPETFRILLPECTRGARLFAGFEVGLDRHTRLGPSAGYPSIWRAEPASIGACYRWHNEIHAETVGSSLEIQARRGICHRQPQLNICDGMLYW